jgi:hypothetical protein
LTSSSSINLVLKKTTLYGGNPMISKRVLLIVAALLVVSATSAMAATVITPNFYVNQLQLPSTGTLSLTDTTNPTASVYGLVTTNVQSSTTTYAPPLGGLENALSVAYDGGLWDGTAGALTNATCTATPAAGPNPAKYALAPLSGSQLTGLGYTTFHGVDMTTQPATAIVQFTYTGDTNLDGAVDTTDFNTVKTSISRINAGTFTGTNDWRYGDLNYDGSIDTTDFNIVKKVISLQNASGSYPTLGTGAAAAVAGAPVPEPSMIVLSLVSLGFFLGFRRYFK